MGTAATKLGELNAMGIIGSQGGRGQVVTLIYQKQGGHGYHNGQQSQSCTSQLAETDSVAYLILVFLKAVDGKPTKYLLDLYKQNTSRLSE